MRSYLSILETIYLIRLVPGWSSGATERAVAMPKVIVVDAGLAAHLASGARSTLPVARLLENFVLGQLARQLLSDVDAQLFHYRDRDQYEVDALLEDNAGQIVGVEVKARPRRS